MTNIYIGVDPGKDGGFSLIDSDGKVICEPWDCDGFAGFCEIISLKIDAGECCAKCCVEKVGAMPGQGVTSMFNFGKSAGFIEGVLMASRIPYQLISPQTWKKEYSLNSDKQKSIDVCKKLFPGVSLRRTSRCTTDHDGMAESLLMAEYARRKL